jgi:hypothetical protein
MPSAINLTQIPQGIFEEAETSFRSQIKVLEEEVARQKVGIRLYISSPPSQCALAPDARIYLTIPS